MTILTFDTGNRKIDTKTYNTHAFLCPHILKLLKERSKTAQRPLKRVYLRLELLQVVRQANLFIENTHVTSASAQVPLTALSSTALTSHSQLAYHSQLANLSQLA